MRSVDSMPHGASSQQGRATIRHDMRGAAPRTPICSSERRRRPVLAWSARRELRLAAQGAADELVGERDAQDQQDATRIEIQTA